MVEWLFSRCECQWTITPQQRSCLLLPGTMSTFSIRNQVMWLCCLDYKGLLCWENHVWWNLLQWYGRLLQTILQESCPARTCRKLYSWPLEEEHTAKQNHQISSCSNVQDQLIICICRAVYKEDVDNVIGCDNENCPYLWLHFTCWN